MAPSTNTRPLPDLRVLLEGHQDACLLWDERMTQHAFLAVGSVRSLTVHQPLEGDWQAWDAFMRETQSRNAWAFGWIGYDAHHTLAGHDDAGLSPLPSPSPEFPVMHWNEPEVVVAWKPGSDTPEVIHGPTPDWLDGLRPSKGSTEVPQAVPAAVPLTPLWTRDEYLERFEAVHRALRRGDLYEMNLCMPWRGDAPGADAWNLFRRLAHTTRAPHSAFIQKGNLRIHSASPERFLQKQGARLTSQPIKGTIRRGATEEEDQRLRDTLANDEKERAENVMIVDLVRNDLSRVAKPASVQVDELFGVHSFATVHQLISTVSCELRDDASLLDIMRATFPMGSMTGAPKESAVKHIAALEGQGRGIYSGCLGYQTPEGDFDLNVVIRTMLQDQSSGAIHATVGGAITLLADGNQEHEECLLKARALRECLRHEG